MKELIILLIIGVSLSIDAFSVSAVIGMTKISIKKAYITSITVGIFHFFMPLLGLYISTIITKSININSNLVLGIILILISMQMFIEYIKPSNKEISLSTLGIIMFSLGVSIDSFTIGFGINAITNNIILSSVIFSLCSSSFTYIGFTLGKYVSKFLKKYSYLVGKILLFLLGISFLFKVL